MSENVNGILERNVCETQKGWVHFGREEALRDAGGFKADAWQRKSLGLPSIPALTLSSPAPSNQVQVCLDPLVWYPLSQ